MIEVQLQIDEDKRDSWPCYLANLRARLRCDVELLVITPHPNVARWADDPIPIGQGAIRPVVLGPDRVLEITDPAAARRNPELAVLSGVAHGRGPLETAVAIAHAALGACAGYPDDRALRYSDVVMAALGEAARAVWRRSCEPKATSIRASSHGDIEPRERLRAGPKAKHGRC